MGQKIHCRTSPEGKTLCQQMTGDAEPRAGDDPAPESRLDKCPEDVPGCGPRKTWRDIDWMRRVERIAPPINRSERPDLDARIRLKPDAVPLRLERAYRRIWEGRFADALSDLEVARVLQPTNAAIYVLRAHVFLQTGRDREALADYRRVAKLGLPEMVTPWQHRLRDAGYYDGPVDGGNSPAFLEALAHCVDEPELCR